MQKIDSRDNFCSENLAQLSPHASNQPQEDEELPKAFAQKVNLSNSLNPDPIHKKQCLDEEGKKSSQPAVDFKEIEQKLCHKKRRNAVQIEPSSEEYRNLNVKGFPLALNQSSESPIRDLPCSLSEQLSAKGQPKANSAPLFKSHKKHTHSKFRLMIHPGQTPRNDWKNAAKTHAMIKKLLNTEEIAKDFQRRLVIFSGESGQLPVRERSYKPNIQHRKPNL